MIPHQRSLPRSQSLHLPNSRSHGLHRSPSHRLSIAPQSPSHYQRNSIAPGFQSTQSQSPSTGPSLSLFLDDVSDSQPLLAPEPNPGEEVSRWSSDSDDSLRLLIPKLFVKSKTLPQLQLPKSVSSLLGDITGSMKERFGFGKEGKESAKEKNESQARDLSQAEEEGEPLTQVKTEEQGEEQDQDFAQDSAESNESFKNNSPTTMSIFEKRASLSSFTSVKTSSSTSTIKPRPASSPNTTIQSSSSSITSTGSSSTVKPGPTSSSGPPSSGATVVNNSTGSAKLADKAPAGKKKVATKGKNDGVWICCLCRKWSFDEHPKCGKCRPTGSKKIEYWPCNHGKCDRCEQYTDLGQEFYGKVHRERGCVRAEGDLLLMLENLVDDMGLPVAGIAGKDENEGEDGTLGGWI
ncbi:hypothetical protein DL98DRAFT_584959 [Cadophora sp. DSE1049]|nr:hypothetical protein DL98DRAFT_584959 [Cadophora sp. DSE1049]